MLNMYKVRIKSMHAMDISYHKIKKDMFGAEFLLLKKTYFLLWQCSNVFKLPGNFYKDYAIGLS